VWVNMSTFKNDWAVKSKRLQRSVWGNLGWCTGLAFFVGCMLVLLHAPVLNSLTSAIGTENFHFSLQYLEQIYRSRFNVSPILL